MTNVLYYYSMIISIILIYLIGNVSRALRNILAIFIFFYSIINVIFVANKGINIPIFSIMNLNFAFTTNSMGYFFNLLNNIIFGILLFNLFNNQKDKDNNGFLFLFFLIFFTTSLLFSSANLFTFFVMWEFITFMIFFIVGIYNIEKNSGLFYIAINSLGGLFLLLSIAIIYNFTGTLDFQELSRLYTLIPLSYTRFVIILFSIAMLIKSGLWGLHFWMNDAYMKSDTIFTAYLSAILSKIGVFGLIILFYKIFPYDYIVNIFNFFNINFFRIFFTLSGSLTALLATVIAIKQQNIKKVLVYSSIAQLGYIIASFGIGYNWGIISVLTITTLHAFVKTSLFADLSFIEYKTGSTDSVMLGGLIKKIPFVFISTLISIIALAGIVPLFGFAAKWIYYENIFMSGHFMALTISMLASTLAFLYCYKILSSVFLGYLSNENESIKYFSSFGDYFVNTINMILPFILVGLGIYTYPFFKLVFNTIGYLNIRENIIMNNNFIESGIGYWNPLWIGTAVMFLFIFILIKFIIVFKKSKRVSQYDIAMSAEIVKPNMYLHYAMNFFDGFNEVAKPIYRIRSFDFYKNSYNYLKDISLIIFKFHHNTISSNAILFLLTIIIIILYVWGVL